MENSTETKAEPQAKAAKTPKRATALIPPFYVAANIGTDNKSTVRTERGGHLVATVEEIGRFDGTRFVSDNAQLFAAAPELLAALWEAHGVLAQIGERHSEYHGTKHGPSFVGAAYMRACAAIAKAEGRA